GIERVDSPVGNIGSDKQGVAERAKIGRRHGETPRRKKRTSDSPQNIPGGVKFVHEAGSRFVATEGHPELATDVLNAVGGKATMDGRIGKGPHQVEVFVENVDAAVGAIVGGIEEVAGTVASDSQARIHGAKTWFRRRD